MILHDDGSYLAIERAASVRAPGRICFPGGGIETGESDRDAVIREMKEELGLDVVASHRLWHSETQSGLELFWWLVLPQGDTGPTPNTDEVAKWFWMSGVELAQHPRTLATNREFLRAARNGLIDITRPEIDRSPPWIAK